MKLQFKKLHTDAQLPQYAHGPNEDAGMDVRCIEDKTLHPGVPEAIKTGLSIELPPGYEAQLRPRSGLAFKHAITIPNSPGTIDPGYRGEIKGILLNLGTDPYKIKAGDKIMQMVIAKYESIEWEESELSESVRGEGGFGSTGVA